MSPTRTKTTTRRKAAGTTETTASAEGRRTEYLPLDGLEVDPRNPKAHDLDTIDASVGRFGIIDPIVRDDRTGRLISGHGRAATLRAMHDRGETPPDGVHVDGDGGWLVPVTVGWASRTDTEAHAALIALNRTTELGGWVDDELLGLLDELSEQDGGTVGIGFPTEDIEDLRARLAALDDDGSGEGAGGGDGYADPWADAPSLRDRFLVPPFSVLNAWRADWQERKRRWLSLGIQSELGRSGRPVYASLQSQNPAFYRAKKRVEERIGRALTTAEFISDYYEAPEREGWRSGISVFDPVVCELAYRWFCPSGGSVLDPFAGGSVRGVVAAVLGHPYTGIELRGEQVEANREQWRDMGPRLPEGAPGPLWHTGDSLALLPKAPVQPPLRRAVPEDSTPDLTPLERRGDYWLKRDDLYSVAGQRGGKVRTCLSLATAAGEGLAGLVTASSRHSPQAMIVSHIARRLGVECRLHMPSGAETEEMAACRAAGAEIIQHRPGYNTVITKRARDDAAEREAAGWVHIPFGMEAQEAVDLTAEQVRSLDALPDGDYRLVVPVGSGMTLAGVLHGLGALREGLRVSVTGVVCGAAPDDRLDRYAPPDWRERAALERAAEPYETAVDASLAGVPLDPHYEAKMRPFVRPGDIVWLVGNREQGGVGSAGLGEATAGQRADLLFSCPPYADLEKYSSDPADISNMPYEEFRAAYRGIIRRACDRLADDRFAVWVVGEVRSPSSVSGGAYRGLVPDTIDAFRDAGLGYYNEFILATPLGSVPLRLGRQFAETRKNGRVHQTVLVFVKGDARRAIEALPADGLFDEDYLGRMAAGEADPESDGVGSGAPVGDDNGV